MPTQSQLERFARLATCIDENRDRLIAILQRSESHETIEDELFKSTDALRNAHIEAEYFDRKVGTAASFLPLNLPLYSLVIFGVIPSAVAGEMFVRAPARLASVLTELAAALDLATSFPEVRVSAADRDTFVRNHAATADLVIFTGKLANAQKLRPLLRRDVLFLFSGRGVNPIVVGPDADLATAIAKTAHVKLFNGGQDCAAPDCIFVHTSRSRAFVEGLRAQLAEVKIGDYTDPGVRIGPLVEIEQLSHAAKHLAEHRANIVHGGRVEFLDGIVHPSVVFYPRFERTNATELFSPLFFVTEYETEEQLESYFATTQYRQNAMYVSLFGSSRAVTEQCHSIVLKDAIVNESERGNLEYGGYSTGASFVQHGKDIKAKPILVSREVHAHLAWRDRLAHGNIVTETVGTTTVHRAIGALPGPRLLVIGAAHGERSGPYACHRLLHELRSKRIRVDAGELVIAIPDAQGSALDALRAEADHVIVLRFSGAKPLVFGDFADGDRAKLASMLGIDCLVMDPELSPGAPDDIVAQCGDDHEPEVANTAFEVILNAARHLELVGGEARPAPVVRRIAVPEPSRLALPASFGDELGTALRACFGDTLVFGFVFGSFAKGWGRAGHDLDTFVCVTRRDAGAEAAYARWLRDAHARLGCVVDEAFPYEVVELGRLEELARSEIALDLASNSAALFDATTWIQILGDAKLFVHGSRDHLAHFEAAFRDRPQAWKDAALVRLPADTPLAVESPLYFLQHVFPFRRHSEETRA